MTMAKQPNSIFHQLAKPQPAYKPRGSKAVTVTKIASPMKGVDRSSNLGKFLHPVKKR